MILKTRDCPDANERNPIPGEEKWTFTFPLETGETLALEMGEEGRNNLRHVILDEMIDDQKKEGPQRFFLDQDNDCHWYLIPACNRKDWDDFLDIPEDDERSWEVPGFANPLGRGVNAITFQNPLGHEIKEG